MHADKQSWLAPCTQGAAAQSSLPSSLPPSLAPPLPRRTHSPAALDLLTGTSSATAASLPSSAVSRASWAVAMRPRRLILIAAALAGYTTTPAGPQPQHNTHTPRCCTSEPAGRATQEPVSSDRRLGAIARRAVKDVPAARQRLTRARPAPCGHASAPWRPGGGREDACPACGAPAEIFLAWALWPPERAA